MGKHASPSGDFVPAYSDGGDSHDGSSDSPKTNDGSCKNGDETLDKLDTDSVSDFA